jgi:hypothetical protein
MSCALNNVLLVLLWRGDSYVNVNCRHLQILIATFAFLRHRKFQHHQPIAYKDVYVP